MDDFVFYRNLNDVIAAHFNNIPKKTIYTFLNDKNEKLRDLSIRELHENACKIAGFLSSAYTPGDRVILIYQPGPEFIFAFLGCLYAGIIAVPVIPPFQKIMLSGLQRIMKDASPVACFTDSVIFSFLSANDFQASVVTSSRLKNRKDSHSLLGIPLINTDLLDVSFSKASPSFNPDPEHLAFLQYTSGSTGKPKGVMVTHRNLLDNVRKIEKFFGHTQNLTVVCWLPFYHDMGLIGNILHMGYLGAHLLIMNPLDFLRNPLSWPEAISKYQASSSGGPNFAYELCSRYATPDRIEALDLNCWDLAFCGAEPVRYETLERFSRTFALGGFQKKAFYSCYGLAENTLIVTGSSKMGGLKHFKIDKEALQNNKILDTNGNRDNNQILVGSGKTTDDQKIKIVNPESFDLCDGTTIGEIWVQGASVAKGYWNKSEQTKKDFHAVTACGDGPYLRTGDLGFIDKDGELFVTGRLKDLIIINGRNYYPQDIEEIVQKSSIKIRPGRSTAFSIVGSFSEKLCIVAEFKGDAKDAATVFNTINQSVSYNYGIKPEVIVLVTPKSLPVTTSGKIKRIAIKSMYLENRLTIIASFQGEQKTRNKQLSNELMPSLIRMFTEQLQISEETIDINAPFGQYGMSSIDAADLTVKLKKITGILHQPVIFYEYPSIRALAEFISNEGDSPTYPVTDNIKKEDVPIAVIGVSCNFPGSPDKESFWKNIEKGKDLISGIPKNRQDLKRGETLHTDNRNNPCRWGGFIDGIEMFDASFFGISSTEATMIDPQSRKLLEVSWEAIEDAGYSPLSLSGMSIGVFIGVSSFDYGELAVRHDNVDNTYATTGVAHSILSNRISYNLNLHGPSESVDTACSSSLIAIHRAVQSIHSGECEQAIVGGVNALLSYNGYVALSKAGILSEDGRCKTFDKSANGFVRGEGAGVVLLKPLSKAISDNDHIYAVIKGSATNHGGKAESLTAPNENAQAGLLIDAYRKSNMHPETISYIETHGTGTALGDPIEINGLKKAFDALSNKDGGKKVTGYCGIGSVKTNIGHLEAAAGIAGFIKVILSLKNKILPATINLNELNPYINVNDSPFYIVDKTKEWRLPENESGIRVPRRAGVSSFGFGGTYAHIVLEESPSTASSAVTSESPVIIPLSAKTKTGLTQYLHALNDYLSDNPTASLLNIAYTLANGRAHFTERLAFVTSSINNLKKILNSIITDTSNSESLFSGTLRTGYSQPPTDISKAIQEKDLTYLAKSWVEGAEIPWERLYKGSTVRRVSLPTTSFVRKPFWFHEKRADIHPEKTEPAKINNLSKSPELTSRQLSEWFKQEVAEILDIPLYEVDSDIAFDDYGVDSIALINLLSNLKEYFQIEISETIIRECPDIRSFVAYIIEGNKLDPIDLNNEAVLDDAIRFDAAVPETGLTYGKIVFLTGATGFFGVFLLRELIIKTDAKIICLIRADDAGSGVARIQSVMKRFLISDCNIENRVTVIPGELRENRLGMSFDNYEFVSEKADTIYHCGAMVDWMKPYQSLKAANVSGTLEIIKLAGNKQIKRLHYISSLAVLPLIEDKSIWYENDTGEPEKLVGGYGQTKWVAEKLCHQARDRGLPVSIYRFDYVAGTTTNGAMKETDFLVRLVKGVAQLGYVPYEETNFDILGVDYLSRIVIEISKSAENINKTYHLINRKPFSTSDFTSLIRQFGYPAQKISFKTWKKLVEGNPSSDLYPLYPFIKQYNNHQFELFGKWVIDNTNTLTALYNSDPELIETTPSAKEIMTKVIQFFQTTGHMPKPDFSHILQRQHTYWENQLDGARPSLELPFGKNRSDLNQKTLQSFSIDVDACKKLAIFCSQNNINPAEALLTIFKVLLLRYTGEMDISVAVQTAAQINTGSEGEMLFSANRPIIRTGFEKSRTFRSALYQVQQLISEADANSKLPDDEILTLFRGPDNSRYDMMFIYRDASNHKVNSLNIAPLELDEVLNEDASLTMIFEKTDNTLQAFIRFAPDMFSEKNIVDMGSHFNKLLVAISKNPDADILSLPLMAQINVDKVLYDFNDTAKVFPDEKCLHRLFSAQVARTPDATAVEVDGESISYSEFEIMTDQLAGYLRDKGLGPNDIAGVCVERSIEMVVALYSIIKAGAAYLPIDIDCPKERLEFILNDASVTTLLTQKKSTSLFSFFKGNIISLDQDNAPYKAYQNTAKYPIGNPDDTAYVIYTSGSTGQPKGCMISHKAICNRLLWMQEEYTLSENDRVLQKTPYTFDVSVWEFFWPLLNGATLVLARPEGHKETRYLIDYIQKQAITVCHFVPSMLRLFLEEEDAEECNSLSRVFTSGEALPYDLMASFLNRFDAELHNLYGPTEAAVDVTCWACHKRKDRQVPIGKPIANTKIHILDKFGMPVPVGHSGELHIGGINLAKGYLNRPVLTRSKFISDPFSDDPDARLYKTGDLARYHTDGNIEYLGRLDFQVKLRGTRIELEEIECKIRQHDLIDDCVVIMREDRKDDQRLAAYIILTQRTERICISDVRNRLKLSLPEFMIPSDYVFLEQFPLTSSGKINRNKLPRPKTQPGNDMVPPSTPVEIQLHALWQQILHIEEVGIHDNFIDSGGSSLLAMKLLVEVNTMFGAELTIQSLFNSLTIAELAKTLVNINAGQPIINKLRLQDFIADTILDPEITMKAPVSDTRSNIPENVLLTGSTGFLGVYLLANILEKTNAAVYCLVRANSEQEGKERIQKSMTEFDLWQDTFDSRIIPVKGDLALPALGISPELLNALAESIDTIYHNGSLVNFSYPYSLLKKPNVDGTMEILRLAARKKPKKLIYISSTSVFETSEYGKGHVVYETDDLPDPEGLFYGYSQSKWVAEKLVTEASAKGMPVMIFRPSTIYGDSRTGASNQYDILNYMLLACAKAKAFPELDFHLDGSPVDHVADTITKVSLNPDAFGQIFHIVNPKSVTISKAFDYVASWGFDYPVMEREAWVKLLLESVESSDHLQSFIPVLTNEVALMNGKTYFEMQSESLPEFSMENTNRFAEENNLACPEINEELCHIYLDYLKKIDFI